MLRSTFFITTVFVFLAAVSRLLPHPANFTPILAISLFAGAYISHRGIALLIPILAMLVSDFFLGFHDLMLPIYALIIGFSLVGRFGLSDNRTALRVGGYSLGGSVVFFLATNFLVWLTSGMYAMNGAGLVQCYTMAIPFFQNQVLGDLFFSAVLFGSMEFLISRNLVLAKVEVRS